MTASDWERVNQDTQRAIEHMRRLIEIAEAGKKRTHGNGSDAKHKTDKDGER